MHTCTLCSAPPFTDPARLPLSPSGGPCRPLPLPLQSQPLEQRGKREKGRSFMGGAGRGQPGPGLPVLQREGRL